MGPVETVESALFHALSRKVLLRYSQRQGLPKEKYLEHGSFNPQLSCMTFPFLSELVPGWPWSRWRAQSPWCGFPSALNTLKDVYHASCNYPTTLTAIIGRITFRYQSKGTVNSSHRPVWKTYTERPKANAGHNSISAQLDGVKQ